MTDDKQIGKAGGVARAARMDQDERAQFAKLGAQARWGIRATHVGELNFGEITMQCAVLEDGRRVISQSQISETLGRKLGGYAYSEHRASERNAEIPVFLALNALKPHISKDLIATLQQSVKYKPLHGGNEVVGLPATILPQICEVWLDARRDQTLTAAQERVAARAEVLLRGLARVGVIALVDEATGYQDTRERQALRKYLELYIRKELAAWAPRFPAPYFDEIFRLKGWERKWSGSQGPRVIARYTKDLVYERLATGVLEELERKNPVEANGRRRAKHHQWLTNDVGHPQLSAHMHGLIGLMRAADSWEMFKRMVDRAYPKKGSTLSLPIP